MPAPPLGSEPAKLRMTGGLRVGEEDIKETLIKFQLCNESKNASLWIGGYTRGRCPLVQWLSKTINLGRL